MTTGSLGQGVSTAIGLALARRQKLVNLVWLVDHNRKQLDGRTEEILDLGDLAAKFSAFGWHVLSVAGNDVEAVAGAVAEAKEEKARPSCVILNTVKGAGIPFVEEIELNHHIPFEGELLEKSTAWMEKILAELAKEDPS